MPIAIYRPSLQPPPRFKKDEKVRVIDYTSHFWNWEGTIIEIYESEETKWYQVLFAISSGMIRLPPLMFEETALLHARNLKAEHNANRD